MICCRGWDSSLAFADEGGSHVIKVAQRLAHCRVGVIHVVIESAELFSLELHCPYTNLHQTVEDGVSPVADLFAGSLVGFFANLRHSVGVLGGEELGEEPFTLVENCPLPCWVIRDDDVETLVHDVGVLREIVDEVDIVLHQHAEQHVILGALDGDQLIEVWANIDPLRADADLHWEVQRIEEVLVAILYPLALTSAHQVEVNRLTGDDGAEAAITHDNHIIAQLREEEAILCGSGLGWSLFLGVLGGLVIRTTLHS